MREARDIVAAYGDLCERGEAGALASVVRTRGSTYRRSGARMLVGPDGSTVGLVGGGCLETDLLEALRSDGVEPTATVLGSLFAPAGLDLGTEAPEEIALSILSEIQAVWRTRGGGFLRERRGPIHDPFER